MYLANWEAWFCYRSEKCYNIQSLGTESYLTPKTRLHPPCSLPGEQEGQHISQARSRSSPLAGAVTDL